MLVVPGSARVRLQAMAEGLDKVFIAAGAEWREAGCSTCAASRPPLAELPRKMSANREEITTRNP